MKTLIQLEISRTLRNKKFMFFSVLYPAALYLLIAAGSKDTEKIGDTGLTFPVIYMVSMATFGAITSVLIGNAERIAKEREKGWVRQLRLTALPGRGYVTAKVASAAVVSLPSILVVFVTAAAAKGVRLEAWQWGSLAAVIWAGSCVFAALGVAIGYLATGDAVRPIVMVVYFGLSMLGGLWMPSAAFPEWLQKIAEYVPTHAYAGLGQAIERGDAPGMKDAAILVFYLVLFAGAAAWLYRRDTHKN
ncbi:ABC transporter permease [Streptomyces sp. AV19]|uniref:ABC transporter permease n=1 Tax=Streptomyces sp. AV19 TaxID=2793068 RepID=UPI0018FE9574|nr:ABC transporter permease [Streptomyces sp. AV19]MBH1935644.1 ABC transporter permease [Streptomyces sp. AV19]MDG4536080.1 ABC transporter permease [Streptomyces sp. AV19]